MNKKHLRSYLIFLVFVFLVSFFIGRNSVAKTNFADEVGYKQSDADAKTNLAVEVGYKQSDAEWLIRMGEISEEEVQKLQYKVEDGCNLKEYNKLLDDLLDGKKEAYLKKQAELNKKISSILNK